MEQMPITNSPSVFIVSFRHRIHVVLYDHVPSIGDVLQIAEGKDPRLVAGDPSYDLLENFAGVCLQSAALEGIEHFAINHDFDQVFHRAIRVLRSRPRTKAAQPRCGSLNETSSHSPSGTDV